MKRSLMFAVVICLSAATSALGDDTTTAWKKVLKNCARTDLIGKQSLFFGISNTVGPGSIWRFADDRSLRLYFELSDIFPKDSDREAMLKLNNIAGCTGSASLNWNLKLGLPLSTGATPVSIDIAAVLGRAHKVTVSVTGFAVDSLKDGDWDDAIRKLDPNDAHSSDLNQQGLIIAENVVKVTGFKAIFTFGTALSADVKASFKGKTFTLGGSSGTTSSAGAPTSNGPGNNPTPTAPQRSGASNTAGNAATASNTSGGCGSSTGTGSTASTAGSGANGGSSSGATFHADVTSNNEITVCADGPFYLLAAYSKLLGGHAVGIVPGQAPLVHEPVAIPSNTATSHKQ